MMRFLPALRPTGATQPAHPAQAPLALRVAPTTATALRVASFSSNAQGSETAEGRPPVIPAQAVCTPTTDVASQVNVAVAPWKPPSTLVGSAGASGTTGRLRFGGALTHRRSLEANARPHESVAAPVPWEIRARTLLNPPRPITRALPFRRAGVPSSLLATPRGSLLPSSAVRQESRLPPPPPPQ